jgi:hypothetical protein
VHDDQHLWSHTLSFWFKGMQPRFRSIDGLSIRFAESEHRDNHTLLLGLWPENLFAFEPIWARLAEHTHLLATTRRKLNAPHHRAPRRFTRG